jgi:hypothetical protein
MKHLEITSLKQFSVVFSSKTFKAKKDLLADAALLTVVPFQKDKDSAAKLAEAMRELADEITKESAQLKVWMERAITQNEYATIDFLGPLYAEALRLIELSQNGNTPEPPKKQWNFNKKKGSKATTPDLPSLEAAEPEEEQ